VNGFSSSSSASFSDGGVAGFCACSCGGAAGHAALCLRSVYRETRNNRDRHEELETLEHNVKAAVEHNKLGTTKRPVEFIKRSTASASSLQIAM
jgi:hypothetical protein